MNDEKTLWQRYGKLALFLVFVLMLITGTVQYLDLRKTKQAEQASLIYEKMLVKAKQSDFTGAIEDANILINQYAKTPYSVLGAFMVSRIELERNNPQKAIDILSLAVSLGKDSPLQDIARIRLARILLSQARYQEALAALPENKETAYTTLFEEVRGDIYFKQNELKKAKEAYAKAMKAAPAGAPLTSLQLKFTDLNVKEES